MQTFELWRKNEMMIAYEFYMRDENNDYQLIGVLPERRKNLLRINQETIMNWVKRYLGNQLDRNDIFFIQVMIDKNTGRIFRPNGEMIVYKVLYKNYELKKGEFIGMLIERRKDLRGLTQIESGLRWAKFTFGQKVIDEKAIFVVPKVLKLENTNKKLESTNRQGPFPQISSPIIN
jgi:hypothetical protein